MPIDVHLPELSASMTEASVIAWRKRIGDAIKPGEVLVELETDKSAVELEASAEGILVEILVPDGAEGVPVGAVLARLAAPGEADAAAAMAPAPPPAREAFPRSGEGAEAPEAPAAALPRSAVHASPLARRMAEQAGLDLRTIRGTGQGGRIMKSDLEALRSGAAGASVAEDAPAGRSAAPPLSRFAHVRGPASDAPSHAVRHTAARRAQAARLAEAKRTIPHFYLAVECELDALLALRAELNARAERVGEARFSVNDLLVRATALAFRRVPQANVSYEEEALRVYDRVDVAIAVAAEGGLVTPIVRDADRKGLSELARELRDLLERARGRRLRPEEYQGGTCTLSNLGMYGVASLQPILNPPQACILGVGAAEPRPVVRDGAVVARTMATCTLAADHRALDGATGATLLAAFRGLVEDPLALLL